MTRIRKEQIRSDVAVDGEVLTADGLGDVVWKQVSRWEPLTDGEATLIYGGGDVIMCKVSV